MNTEDLMLGDYVLHENKIKRVDLIWGKHEVSLYGGETWGTMYDKTNIEDIEPIKITKEFLEQVLGYHIPEKDDWWESEDKRVRITNDYDMVNEYGKRWALHVDSECMDTIMKCDVNYVHELQHAFKLCNYKQEFKLV